MTRVIPETLIEYAYVAYFTVTPNVKTTINGAITNVNRVRIVYDLLNSSKVVLDQESKEHFLASSGKDTTEQVIQGLSQNFSAWVLADKKELSGYEPPTS